MLHGPQRFSLAGASVSVPKHRGTRRIASTSRWGRRGCTGTTRVFLWAEGWGCALGSGLCLWGALQSRTPHAFPSARVLSSPAGHPPGWRSGSSQRRAQPEPAQGRNTPAGSYRTGPRSSPSGGFVAKGQGSQLGELRVVGPEQRHRGLHVPPLARCWNNSPHPTEVSHFHRAIPGFFDTCSVPTRSGLAADLVCKVADAVSDAGWNYAAQKLPGVPAVGAACVPLSETGRVGWLPSCSASCSVSWSIPLERKQDSRIGCDVLSSGTELLQP